MKSIKLTLALVFVGTLAFGQDRTNAIMAFKDFSKAVQDQNFDKAEKSIKEAKDYIDKAYTATPTDHKTLFYKGQIYASMALTYIDPASFASMAKDPCSGEPKIKAGVDEKKAKADMEMYAQEAAKAFKGAMENPSKKDDFTTQIITQANIQSITAFNCGSKFFNDKKYDLAVKAYEQSIAAKDIIGVKDTLAYYNSALCYERLKDYPNAIKMWSKCTELKYGGADAFSGLSSAYRNAGNEEDALNALQKGRATYPKDQGLIINEVNYHLGKGDNASAEKAINEAIAIDSKNPTLYFALGSVYDNLKQYDKAEESYKKALTMDPNYFDALYNLGAMKYNEGVEIINKIKDIADDAQYNAEKAKADEKFKQALPYNEKAKEINQRDKDNLTMLKNIYTRLGNLEKASEINSMLKN